MREFRLRARTLHLLIRSTSSKDYYVTDRGNIISVDSSVSGEARRKKLELAEPRKARLKPTSAYPGIIKTVRVGKEDIVLKKEIVKAFTNCGNLHHYQIQHKDGNPDNCALNNLVVYDLKEASSFKRMGKLVVFYKDGRIETYGSYNACADALFVNRRTLNNYLHDRNNKSVINETVAKIQVIERR